MNHQAESPSPKEEPPCRACQSPAMNSYNGVAPEAVQERHPHLEFVETWKVGMLYRCAQCGRYWLLREDDGRFLPFIDGLDPLTRRWYQRPLTLDDAKLQQLSRIGGVLARSEATITIPCSVRNIKGEAHKNAVVLISKGPPGRWHEAAPVHWADEIESIEPSPDALPVEVRQASHDAPDVAMAYAPTVVEDRQGNRYSVRRESRFFNTQGVRGEEIKLCGYQGEWRERLSLDYLNCCCGGCLFWPIFWLFEQVGILFAGQPKLPTRPAPVDRIEDDAYYFVDWFEGCEELLVPSPTLER